jgi:hypothetical protein
MVRCGLVHSIPGVALLLVGIVLSLVGNGSTALFAAGLAMVGIGGVILASVFFYEVGRSEDEARGREQRPPTL